jgi:hypothetical protein
MQAQQHVPRQGLAEAGDDDAMQVTGGKRGDLDFEQSPAQVAFELQWRGPGLDSDCEAKLDLLVCQAPGGEPERRCGRAVEPLQVVDREENRIVRGQDAQPREDGQADDALVQVPRLSIDKGEGSLDRRSLRRRKAGQYLRDVGRQQVSERRERERGLARSRPACKHPPTSTVRSIGRRTPQRRLADPGHAFQPEHLRAAAMVDEGVQLLELDLAPNDFRGVVVDVRPSDREPTGPRPSSTST